MFRNRIIKIYKFRLQQTPILFLYIYTCLLLFCPFFFFTLYKSQRILLLLFIIIDICNMNHNGNSISSILMLFTLIILLHALTFVITIVDAYACDATQCK